MNYQEMETLFREEQRSLDRNLRLSLSTMDLGRFSGGWRMVRRSAGRMQPGGWADKVSFAGGLAIICFQPNYYLAYLPLIVSFLVLLVNLNVYPFRPIPQEGLERYTTAEMAREVARLRRYVAKRNLFDAISYGLWLIAFMLWYFSWITGNDLLQNPALISPYLQKVFGLAVLSFCIAGPLLTFLNIQQLKTVEEKLRGFYDEDYV